MKKVLILTVTAGEGHNSVASSLKTKFESYDDVKVKTLDIFKEYSSKTKAFFIDDGYRAACKYALGIYNMIYKALLKRDPLKKETSPAQKTIEKETPYILKAILDFKPDLILCTHFYGAIILTNIRKLYPLNVKIGTVLTDYCVHPFWEATTGIDYIFTPCEEVESTLISKGFKKEQIVCLGLPVKEKFSINRNKNECREKLKLNKDLFTVMLMTGGGGFGGIKNLFKSLLKVKTPIQIIVINGKDKNSKKSISNIIKFSKPKHKIINLGFINNIEEYMCASDCLVGKCGGISTTESLCSRLPLISISRLAEQELANLKFLIEKNACFVIDVKHKLNKIIDEIIANPKLLEDKKKNIDKIRKPNALNDICEFMLKDSTADYSILTILEKISNKEILRGIREAKKQIEKYDKTRKNVLIVKAKNLSKNKMKRKRQN